MSSEPLDWDNLVDSDSTDSEIVKARLLDVCPNKSIKGMDVLEVEKGVRLAFKIIGYLPENFDDDFSKTWGSSSVETLGEFAYEVWRCSP